MVYLPPVDMRHAIQYFIRQEVEEKTNKPYKKTAETGGMKIWMRKQKKNKEYHTACRHSDSIKNYIQLVQQQYTLNECIKHQAMLLLCSHINETRQKSVIYLL